MLYTRGFAFMRIIRGADIGGAGGMQTEDECRRRGVRDDCGVSG